MSTYLPLHAQIFTTSLNITTLYSTIISSAGRGRYIIALNISGSFIGLFELIISSSGAQCVVSSSGFGMKLEPFYNNVSTCSVYNNDTTYMLQFQYSSGTLSVQTISGGTLNSCTFVITYIGLDTPANGTSIIALDKIQASTGSNISFNSSISTKGRFRNIKTLTTNTTLDNTYDIVNCNPTGTITITLPQTTLSTGASYSFVNMSTNSITISTSSTDTIDNGLSTSNTLSTQFSKLTLTNLGNGNWFSNI